jgi:hypothetical protein
LFFEFEYLKNTFLNNLKMSNQEYVSVTGFPFWFQGWNSAWGRNYVRKDVDGKEAYYLAPYNFWGVLPIHGVYIVQEENEVDENSGVWRVQIEHASQWLPEFKLERTNTFSFWGPTISFRVYEYPESMTTRAY